jgi:hypothetical protein
MFFDPESLQVIPVQQSSDPVCHLATADTENLLPQYCWEKASRVAFVMQ